MLTAGVPSGKDAFKKVSRRKKTELHSKKPVVSLEFKYEPVEQTVRDAGSFEVVEYCTAVGVYRFVYRGTEPWVLEAPSVALSSLPAPHNQSMGLYALRKFSKNDAIGFYGGELHEKGDDEYTHALNFSTRLLKKCQITGGNYVVDAVRVNPPPFLGSMNSSFRLDYVPNMTFKDNGCVYCQVPMQGIMTASDITPVDILNLPLQQLEKYELLISYGKGYNIPKPSATMEQVADWSNWGRVTLPRVEAYAQAQDRDMQLVHSRGKSDGAFSVVHNVKVDAEVVPDAVHIQLQLLLRQVYRRVKVQCSKMVINAIKTAHPCSFGYQRLAANEYLLHKRTAPATSGPVLCIDPAGNATYFVGPVCFLQETVSNEAELEAKLDQISECLQKDVRVEYQGFTYLST